MSADPILVEYYAQRAGEFERVYHKPERQEELRQLKDWVRTALTGRNVLEVACGTGYWTEVAAASAASIAAFDINEEVLEIARRKPIDPRKVTFAPGDAYHPPSARRCDAALVAFWWSHMPRAKWAAFLRGLHAALHPGAVVVIMDNTFVPGESTAIARTDSEGNTYQSRRLDSGQTFEVLKNHPTEDELRTAVGDDARHIEIKWLKYYWWLRYQFSGPG